MNAFDKNYGCYDCGASKPCKPCGECGPAPYQCDFSISAVPFDPTSWNVIWCGKINRVKIPPISEKDTTLSIDYSGATLNYQAERHVDIITGKQLGSIINLGDLRDTKVDYDTEALCYELIYHKYGECGDGCRSAEDAWSTFSIDSDGALGPQIRYVRGANRYGCPYFLDVPPNPNQYWFQGWRMSGSENGYYQAKQVDKLPTDSNGDPIVMSEDPVTKQPILGSIPLNCLIENIMGNIAGKAEGVWIPAEGYGTAGFGAEFNAMAGDFTIKWTDWNDEEQTKRAGDGAITGKMNWTKTVDFKSGNMTYTIENVYFDKMTWTPVQGVTVSTKPVMTLTAVNPTTGALGEQIMAPVQFNNTYVEQPINRTVPFQASVTLSPAGKTSPLHFVNIYVDWVIDDKGDLAVVFESTLGGWNQC